MDNIKKGSTSYYSNKFNGRRTSSGEIFNNKHYTAAHPFLPFGTLVRVTNQKNGKFVIVKINDRFHPQKGHLLDITIAAAKEIDAFRQGMTQITMEVVDTSKVSKFIISDSIPLNFVNFKLTGGKIELSDKPRFPVHEVNLNMISTSFNPE